MGQVILKQKLDTKVVQGLFLNGEGQLMSISYYKGEFYAYYVSDPSSKEKIVYEIYIIGTGDEIDGDRPLAEYDFRGTFRTDSGYVLHVFSKVVN